MKIPGTNALVETMLALGISGMLLAVLAPLTMFTMYSGRNFPTVFHHANLNKLKRATE